MKKVLFVGFILITIILTIIIKTHNLSSEDKSITLEGKITFNGKKINEKGNEVFANVELMFLNDRITGDHQKTDAYYKFMFYDDELEQLNNKVVYEATVYVYDNIYKINKVYNFTDAQLKKKIKVDFNLTNEDIVKRYGYSFVTNDRKSLPQESYFIFEGIEEPTSIVFTYNPVVLLHPSTSYKAYCLPLNETNYDNRIYLCNVTATEDTHMGVFTTQYMYNYPILLDEEGERQLAHKWSYTVKAGEVVNLDANFCSRKSNEHFENDEAGLVQCEWEAASGEVIKKVVRGNKATLTYRAPEDIGTYEVKLRLTDFDGKRTEHICMVYVDPDDPVSQE